MLKGRILFCQVDQRFSRILGRDCSAISKRLWMQESAWFKNTTNKICNLKNKRSEQDRLTSTSFLTNVSDTPFGLVEVCWQTLQISLLTATQRLNTMNLDLESLGTIRSLVVFYKQEYDMIPDRFICCLAMGSSCAFRIRQLHLRIFYCI